MSHVSLPHYTVPVITNDAQALAVAEDIAAHLQQDSVLRDRERRLPHAELELFSRSGLWGISVPKAYGGAGVSTSPWPRSLPSSPRRMPPWARFRKTISTPSKCCG